MSRDDRLKIIQREFARGESRDEPSRGKVEQRLQIAGERAKCPLISRPRTIDEASDLLR
jgi:hypothetical protein